MRWPLRDETSRLGALSILGLALAWGCQVGLETTPSRPMPAVEESTGVEQSPEEEVSKGISDGALDTKEPTTADAGSDPVDAHPGEPVLNDELVEIRSQVQAALLGSRCGPLGYAETPDENREDPSPDGSEKAPPEASEAAAPATSCVADSDSSPFVSIENQAALEPFHRALGRLARGRDRDGKVRILAYGASHTQADVYTDYLRRYLQRRFGNGGQGFVALGKINGWYRTLDSTARHHALKVRYARYRRAVTDEPLGLFGAAFVGWGVGAYGEVSLGKNSPNTQFSVRYLEQPGGAAFSVYRDGKSIARVSTEADEMGIGKYTFSASPGRHEIRARLEGGGPVRLFGVVAETDGPGVVVDTLGIGGSRLTDAVRWHEELWIEALRGRSPDLVTFAYGTNESLDVPFSIEFYERNARKVMKRFRHALPRVSCVFISPFDLARSHDTLLAIIEAQRRIAAEFDCGFWDGHAFMGGSGSMKRWVKARPPLAAKDYVHLTRLGYVYTGVAFTDALMRAYDLDPRNPAGSSSSAADLDAAK